MIGGERRQYEKRVFIGIAGFSVAAFLLLSSIPLSSQQGVSARADKDDIGGVVTSAKGVEAGVWVIAETTDLPTRFAKMVVTDDRGRYMLPDLPKATYSIWVRGYGLVDSPKVKGTPGTNLNLKAVVAPNEAAAAKYYPAIYWYSMLNIPDKAEFGGKGKIPAGVTQAQWLTTLKNRSCIGCHQLGQLATRTFPKNIPHPIDMPTSEEAW
ncbi:MAG TPA: carboxypeptidase-like regulatory domain-containing protein, partial [Candidatus Binatia bacterium]|nr:carboxypeptidase-like regulatory domain-containing protein [Candidatus Binatia bacterium]